MKIRTIKLLDKYKNHSPNNTPFYILCIKYLLLKDIRIPKIYKSRKHKYPKNYERFTKQFYKLYCKWCDNEI